MKFSFPGEKRAGDVFLWCGGDTVSHAVRELVATVGSDSHPVMEGIMRVIVTSERRWRTQHSASSGDSGKRMDEAVWDGHMLHGGSRPQPSVP